MERQDVLNTIIKILEDNKAEDIINLNVKDLTNVTDWMVICSATSKRHAHALGDHVMTNMKEMGYKPIGVEGETNNEWILIDFADVVVHIMLPEVREFYNLEKLWAATLKVREDAG